MRDKAAIVGVGYTPFSRDSGVSTLALAAEAIKNALADAGLTKADVDGLACHSVADSCPLSSVAAAMDIDPLNFYLDQNGGGSTSHSIVGSAAMAVAAGVADVVVCYRSLNARSGQRMGQMGSRQSAVDGSEAQYRSPYGCIAAAHQFALATRYHMQKYGTTQAQLGAVSVAQREYAVHNERAMLRTPITLDDYFASRWISEPLHLLDCCLETDGACAVVVTSAERAKDLAQRPVYIGGAAWAGGAALMSADRTDPTITSVSRYMADTLYARAGVGPADIDVAELYDCFTVTVLMQLEAYGFCAPGEAGAFVAAGETRLGGALPVNTHGGFLSEGYIHGLNHLAEAVGQLRGHAGARQVPGAEVALSAAQPGVVAGNSSALILHV